MSGPSLMALAHLARIDGPARGAIAEASGRVLASTSPTLLDTMYRQTELRSSSIV